MSTSGGDGPSASGGDEGDDGAWMATVRVWISALLSALRMRLLLPLSVAAAALVPLPAVGADAVAEQAREASGVGTPASELSEATEYEGESPEQYARGHAAGPQAEAQSESESESLSVSASASELENEAAPQPDPDDAHTIMLADEGEPEHAGGDQMEEGTDQEERKGE